MRRIVSFEMLETIPSSMSFLANSLQSHCERDLPATAGRSQAIFTRWIATSGGEKRLFASPGFVVKTKEPLFLEPAGPLVNGSSGNPDSSRDSGHRNPIGQHEYDSGSSCLTITDGGGSKPGFKLLTLFGGEENSQVGLSALGHGTPLSGILGEEVP